MSFRAQAWAWDQKNLTATEKLTLMSLTQFADNITLDCFPRVKLIADDAGIAESSAERAIKSLEAHGLIRIDHRHRDDGSLTSSRYTLLIPPGGPTEKPGGVPQTPGGDVTQAPGGVPQAEPELYQVTVLGADSANEGFSAGSAEPALPKKIVEPKPKSKIVEVDEAFIDRMIAEFSAKLGGEQAVRERIEEALAHKSAKNYDNRQLHLRGWLRRDAERYRPAASGNSGGGHHIPSHAEVLRSRWWDNIDPDSVEGRSVAAMNAREAAGDFDEKEDS